ncbi:MAG: ASKHA domain-containing protein, partial [Shimia sp.]
SSKHAMALGMIPDAPLEAVTSAGNAAGTGARIALLNRDKREEIEETVRKIEKIETAIEPRFQEHFVNASALPNSSDPFPILRALIDLPDVSFNTGGEPQAGGRRRKRARMTTE